MVCGFVIPAISAYLSSYLIGEAHLNTYSSQCLFYFW